MSYPEVPFKARVIDNFNEFKAGQEVVVTLVSKGVWQDFFYIGEDFEIGWLASRFEVIQEPEETANMDTSDEPQFKVVCNKTYTLTIKGITFELTSDEFTELEKAMEDF